MLQKTVGLPLVLGLSLASLAIAESTAPLTGAEPFDLNLDRRIDPDEFGQFLLDQIRLPLSTLDEDGNGQVSHSEIRQFSLLLSSLESSVEKYREQHPEGLERAEFADFVGIEPAEAPPPLSWFERTGVLIRGKLQPIGPDTLAKPLAGVGAATLSFSQDLQDGKAWSTLRGVLMRPIRIESRSELSVTPSLSINQVRYREEASNEVDTLGVRLSLERYYPITQHGLIDSLGLRMNPAYITDSQGDTRILSAEVQLQAGMVAQASETDSPSGFLTVRWQPLLFAEYGSVLSNTDSQSDDGRRFARIGPALDAEMRFAAIDGLSLGLSVEHFFSLTRSQSDRQRLELAVTVALDRAGHFSLQALYVDGDASAKLENEAYWSLGLGVKY